MLVKSDHFPNFQAENKKIFETTTLVLDIDTKTPAQSTSVTSILLATSTCHLTTRKRGCLRGLAGENQFLYHP